MERERLAAACPSLLLLISLTGWLAVGCSGRDSDVMKVSAAASVERRVTDPIEGAASSRRPEVVDPNAISAGSEEPCEVGAPSEWVPANEKQTELLSGFGPALPGVEASAVLTADQAALKAEGSADFRDVPPGSGTVPEEVSTSAYLSYGSLMQRFGKVIGFDQRIDLKRCVWVVTVRLPYTPQHQSPQAKTTPTKPYQVYNSIIDAASGEAFALVAGEVLVG